MILVIHIWISVWIIFHLQQQRNILQLCTIRGGAWGWNNKHARDSLQQQGKDLMKENVSNLKQNIWKYLEKLLYFGKIKGSPFTG